MRKLRLRPVRCGLALVAAGACLLVYAFACMQFAPDLWSEAEAATLGVDGVLVRAGRFPSCWVGNPVLVNFNDAEWYGWFPAIVEKADPPASHSVGGESPVLWRPAGSVATAMPPGAPGAPPKRQFNETFVVYYPDDTAADLVLASGSLRAVYGPGWIGRTIDYWDGWRWVPAKVIGFDAGGESHWLLHDDTGGWGSSWLHDFKLGQQPIRWRQQDPARPAPGARAPLRPGAGWDGVAMDVYTTSVWEPAQVEAWDPTTGLHTVMMQGWGWVQTFDLSKTPYRMTEVVEIVLPGGSTSSSSVTAYSLANSTGVELQGCIKLLAESFGLLKGGLAVSGQSAEYFEVLILCDHRV